MRLSLSMVFFIGSFYLALGQNPTIGLIFSTEAAYDGYTLFTPESNNDVYMINNCGGVIKQWTFDDRPNRTCYLLENGSILRAGDSFLQLKSWDNKLIWSYDLKANGLGQHHDIEPLPNGNLLCIAYDDYTKDEMIAAGRNPLKTDNEFRLDKIVELKPIGTSGGEIVWEWKLFDHLVQDFDVSKQNFGNISESVGRMNINFDNGETFNFCHINGIDYNPVLDQILFSARNLSEIYIIDHSTSLVEAQSSEGGAGGKGGDFLWRWGNTAVYDQGSLEDQKLFSQHDPKWIPQGYQDEGMITVFNNRPRDVTRDNSSEHPGTSIHIIATPFLNNAYSVVNSKYLPEGYEWSWSGDILGSTLNEGKKSGVHALPNRNIIVCETGKGRISEMNRSGEVVWSFVNPAGAVIFEQFTSEINTNSIFRGEKYPTDFPAFIGRDLRSSGFLENENSLSAACGETARNRSDELVTSTFSDKNIRMVNPVLNGRIEFFGNMVGLTKVEIISLSGERVLQLNHPGRTFDLSLDEGIYIFLLFQGNTISMEKIIFRP